jgi:hypothetical protein|tara:strand:+ start:3029 stop:3814 length:786 start_codon:yes stop_codon:yes gene_type:complete
MNKNILLFAIFALIFTSCQKVIDLKLKSSETKYVLKGEVVAGDSTHYLSITTTIPFDQPNAFPGVSGAIVTLSDDLGNSTAMVDAGQGDYFAYNFLAVEGRTYTMTVVIEGETIESTCTMPFTVPLFGAVALPSSFFGLEGNLIVPGFQDPAEYVNYYRFRYFEKDSMDINDSGDIISDDGVSNGQINQQPFIGGYFPLSGDTVIYRMYGIPESVYTFYFSKQTNTNSGSGSPANPISNWSGDVLGYFTAHNVQEIELVIP